MRRHKAPNLLAAAPGGNPDLNPKGDRLARTPTVQLASTSSAAWGCPDLSPRVLPVLGRHSLDISRKPAKCAHFARRWHGGGEHGAWGNLNSGGQQKPSQPQACGMPTVPAGTAPAQARDPPALPVHARGRQGGSLQHAPATAKDVLLIESLSVHRGKARDHPVVGKHREAEPGVLSPTGYQPRSQQ